MRTGHALLGLALLLAPAARANPPVSRVALTFEAYAVGLHILNVQAFLGLGPWNYQVELSARTVGIARLLHPGQQVFTARGDWRDGDPVPDRYLSQGTWGGAPKHTLIEFDHGQPEVRVLEPANPPERAPVPPDLTGGSVDLLSALAALTKEVERSGSCALNLRLFDGRTLREITAHSAGEVNLPPSGRSSFAGPALRCDFAGRTLAGFLRGDAETNDPEMHGSVWFGAPQPGGPKVPVRIGFATHLFGTATAYLTGAEEGAIQQAAHSPS